MLGLPVNGFVRDTEIAAARRHFTDDLIRRICDERLVFLKSLKTWPVFGKGWGRRVAEVKSAALAMAKAPAVLPSAKTPTSAPNVIGGMMARLAEFFRKIS